MSISGFEKVLAVLLVHARDVLNGDGTITVESGYAQFDSPRHTRIAKIEARDYATLNLTCSNDQHRDQEWEKWFSGSQDLEPKSAAFVLFLA